MRFLELRFPPPIIGIITLAFMSVTQQWFFTGVTTQKLNWLIFVLAVCISGIIAFMSLWQFLQVKTTLKPKVPEEASTLVTNGIFQFSRNPMYLSLATFLMGIVGLLGNFWLLGWVVIFVTYITRFQIMPEERILQRKFQYDYADYLQKVRRWI